MIRVFLDATVLFSAARNPEGMNRDLLNIAEERGDVILLSNWVVVDEADIKLMYMALRRERSELASLVAKYVKKCAVAPVELNQLLLPLTPDPHDAPVLAGAVSANANWLITANVAHFGHLYNKEIRGVLVLNPETALRQLISSAERR